MFLALDIGNSGVKAGMFADGKMVGSFEMLTDLSASVAAYRHSLRGRMEDLTPVAAGISSVVPEMTDRIARAVREEFMIVPVIIGPGAVKTFEIDYNPVESLGIDRLCGVAAADHKYGLDDDGNARPVLVVDAGTAITFDLLVDGVFRGGSIMPGPGLMAEAIAARTARLPEIDLEVPSRPVANSTVGGLRSGIMFGYLDAVSGMIRRITEREKRSVFVVSTGGGGSALADYLTDVDRFDPTLVLEGIAILAAN